HGAKLLGSARASRAGDHALVLANFRTQVTTEDPIERPFKVRFGEAPKPAREGACGPRTRVFACCVCWLLCARECVLSGSRCRNRRCSTAFRFPNAFAIATANCFASLS